MREMRIRSLPVSGTLVVAVMKRALTVLVAGLALVLAPLGAADTTYSDPAGDSGTAPDITAVAVSNTDAVITFRVATRLVPMSILGIDLDADRNPFTGQYGIDRMIGVFVEPNGSVNASLADGFFTYLRQLTAVVSADSVEVSVAITDLGVTSGFDFDTETAGDLLGGNEDMDWAPDKGMWTYMLATPPPPAVVTPLIGKPVATPAAPVAGKRFTISVPITRSDNGMPLTAGTVGCKTTVAGKTIPHTHTFKSGVIKATLVVPKAAKGKQLKIAVKVTAGGQAAAKTFTFRVK
jgi:hypothetical protein